MCGRFACNFSKKRLQQACTYKPAGSAGQTVIPDWLNINYGGDYAPSYNIGPSTHTPVLVSNSHWPGMCDGSDRVLVPMSWGLVPSWHKGDPKDFGLKTINCRIEGILEKPTYKTPLVKGQRCVVLAEGFYEWKLEKGGKQPYYLYFPQTNNVNMTTRNWEQDLEETDLSTGPRLLTMAGLFDTTHSQSGDILLSYTIITRSSPSSLSWLHSRMPAILDGEEVIEQWLDSKNVSFKKALNLLDGPVNLEWHPVSSVVGNVRNKGVDCILPTKTRSNDVQRISNWFKPVSSKSPSQASDSSQTKKLKTEK